MNMMRQNFMIQHSFWPIFCLCADKQNIFSASVDGIGLWKVTSRCLGYFPDDYYGTKSFGLLSFQFCNLRYRGIKSLFMRP